MVRHLLRYRIGVGVALAVATTPVQAQTTPRGLDVETLSGEAASVYRVWQRYLASKNGQWSALAATPSSDWLQSEQQRWPVYDLAAFYIPNGAIPEIASVEPSRSCGRPAYRVTTRFRSITYVFPANYPYDAARARRAVAFADSVASAFSLPRLDSLTYYLAQSVDEMNGIIGLEYPIKYGSGPVGGLAQPINNQLFSGNPRIGEDYRHEIAHLILAPLCCDRTSYFVSEGVPTWLGGTAGMDFPTAARGLAAFLADHPAVSLDSILSGSYANAVFYPAGAVLVAMVFEQGGIAAVKALFSAGRTPAELRLSLERDFGRPWSAIALDWRRRATAARRAGLDRQ